MFWRLNGSISNRRRGASPRYGVELGFRIIRWVQGFSPRWSWGGWLINHFHLRPWLIPGDIPPFLNVFTVSCLATQETTRPCPSVKEKKSYYLPVSVIWRSGDRASWSFLITKPTRCTNFSILFCNKTVHVSDSSFVHHQEFCTVHMAMVYVLQFADSLRAASRRNASCQQTCMTYTIAVCTVKNSWWWTEELSETCGVLFQNKLEISASSWFYYKNFQC